MTKTQAINIAKKISTKKRKTVKKYSNKKSVPKKNTKTNSVHKDTKSHNVNIRVLSGVDKNKAHSLNRYKMIDAEIKNIDRMILMVRKWISETKQPFLKSQYRKQIKDYQRHRKLAKQELTIVKKML